MAFLAGQRPTATQLNRAVQKILARGSRSTNSTTTTSIVGVIRLDDIPILAGYTYRVYTNNLRITGGANDGVEVTLRCTFDGSTPTTASTAFATGGARIDSASIFQDVEVSFTRTPASDETLSVLLCVARTSGTAGSAGTGGNSAYPLELYVENKGPDVGDTGTDI